METRDVTVIRIPYVNERLDDIDTVRPVPALRKG